MVRQVPTKAARGETVVNKVLECALVELSENGYGGLSLDRVAERAGVAKTTVWRRWPNRAELAAAAMMAHINRITAGDVDGPLRKTLFTMLRGLADHFQSDVGRGLYAAFSSACGSEELGHVLERAREQGEIRPRRLIRRAIERGELPPSVDVHLTFDLLAGALKHRVFHSRRPVGDAYLRKLIDTVLAGVSAVGETEDHEPASGTHEHTG